VSLERVDPGPEQHPHAVIGVDVAVDRTELDTEDALQRNREGIEHRDLRTELTGRGGDLGADPAGAHHDHPAARPEALTQRFGVPDCP
jgi:hypothetical protein